MLDHLGDRKLAVHAGISTAIRKIGPVALYDTLEQLKHGNAESRSRAAGLLGNLFLKDGTPIEEAIPALARALSDADELVRHQAVMALCMAGIQAKPAVPELVQALNDSDWSVREWAAEALGAIGPDAKEAVGALTELLLDDVPPVREAASGALDQIGPPPF